MPQLYHWIIRRRVSRSSRPLDERPLDSNSGWANLKCRPHQAKAFDVDKGVG
jgi:hypothetical protein